MDRDVRPVRPSASSSSELVELRRAGARRDGPGARRRARTPPRSASEPGWYADGLPAAPGRRPAPDRPPGRELGPRAIATCVDVLGAERIDHGLSILDDPDGGQRFVDERIAADRLPELEHPHRQRVPRAGRAPVPGHAGGRAAGHAQHRRPGADRPRPRLRVRARSQPPSATAGTRWWTSPSTASRPAGSTPTTGPGSGPDQGVELAFPGSPSFTATTPARISTPPGTWVSRGSSPSSSQAKHHRDDAPRTARRTTRAATRAGGRRDAGAVGQGRGHDAERQHREPPRHGAPWKATGRGGRGAAGGRRRRRRRAA